tara:strand:+ start:1154 stop:1345 length:192 start_codon:yes stop_codon:yes gene_type:complete
MWRINGVVCETEEQLRDYCWNYTVGRGGFKQDHRLASIAYSAPISQLLERLEALGHQVERDVV